MKTVIDISNLPNPGVAVPTERFAELLTSEQERDRLLADNAKLRFLISEVIETQPVTEACREDLFFLALGIFLTLIIPVLFLLTM